MRIIDLKSDTVTQPTPEMLASIMTSPLGDDVYGEDLTVNELERQAAEILGKEAALLVSSGTQGNQIAVLCHTQRGDGVIVEQESHIYCWEAGAMTAIAGVHPIVLQGIDGMISIETMLALLASQKDIHSVNPKLICLENPHNSAGGTILPIEYLQN